MKKRICVLSMFFLASVLSPILLSASTAQGSSNYKVGAYYFGVWYPSSFRSDPWFEVREYYQGNIIPPWVPWYDEDFSHLRPVITQGFYDNSQASVLEKHIRQARANGLAFFNFYWYWNSAENNNQGGEFIAGGLQAFLAAKNTEDLEFAISITSHPWGDLDIPANHASTAVNLIIEEYLTKPHYLKTSNGRPVLFLLDTRGIMENDPGGNTYSNTVNFIALLIQEINAQMNVDPFIVINSELNVEDPNEEYYLPVRDLYAYGVDGYSCLNFFGASLPPNESSVGSFVRYNNSLTSLFQYFNNVPNTSFIPCFMSDFNEKPRTKVRVSWESIRYLNDWNLSELNRGLRNVKAFMDQFNQGVVNNYVTLYSWNEWSENGHLLEPSETLGNQQLNEVAQVFQLITFGNAECKVNGDCTQSFHMAQGTLDVANCDTIAGWARDADTSQPIWVHIYKGGPYGQGGSFVTAVEADQLRSDLPFRDQKHGFSISTPTAFKTSQPEQIYVYAIGINGNGDPGGGNPLLSGVPKTIDCTQSLYMAEGTLDVANCNTIAGWARDADTSQPIWVHIYKGAPYPQGTFVTAVEANLFRGDLPFPDKNHGFSISTPNAFKTGQQEKVYVYAIGVGQNGQPGGGNPLLNGVPKMVKCPISRKAAHPRTVMRPIAG
jgi:hypothetical protein